MERKQHRSLDLAKFIAAILIIILHTAPMQSYSGVLNYGFRHIVTIIAVPFFFITSGYLCFSKLNELDGEQQKSYMYKYIHRLVVIYCLWSAVYFIFIATDWIQNGVSPTDVLQYVKRFFFEGSYLTIWFLPALISATLLVYFLSRKAQYRTVICFALPCYVVACLGSSYYGLAIKLPLLHGFFDAYYSFFDTVKNGVLFGFVYVALGAYFAKWQFQSRPIKWVGWICLFWCLMAGEALIHTALGCAIRGVDTKLMLLPLSICIFLFVLGIELPQWNGYVWLRKLSMMMFLSQRIFLTIFEKILSNTIFVRNTMIYFLCILALTILFSAGFIKLSEKYKLLKHFY